MNVIVRRKKKINQMLEKLQIRGFGANKKLDLEFSPTVTTIVGKSFRGKSWILRALKWVMRNQPSGDSFINWDSKESKVRLSVDNKRIVRKRDKKSNSAGSYSFSGKEHPYLAFNRNEAPKEIAEFLNVSDINFQTQHSLPFWFSQTAGQVSRELNSIIDLEIIDKTLRNIESEKHETSAIVRLTKKSLSDLQREKKEKQYIKDLDRDLSHLEDLRVEYNKVHEECSVVDDLLKSVQIYINIQKNASGLTSDAGNVLSVGDLCLKTTESVERLSDLVQNAEKFNAQCKSFAELPSLDSLDKLHQHFEDVSESCLQLEDFVDDILNVQNKIQKLEIQISENESEMKRISKGRCVLCGKELN